MRKHCKLSGTASLGDALVRTVPRTHGGLNVASRAPPIVDADIRHERRDADLSCHDVRRGRIEDAPR